MSGICGLVDFDLPNGDAPPEAVLRRMTAAGAHRGPDGVRSAVRGAAALAHLALHATPGPALDRQPLASRDGALLLVADARLDNRPELISALGREDGAPGDGSLILAAYRRWGTRCAEHLVGDFAFAVWDAAERRLFCARDPFAARPLVWARAGALLCFASEVRQVLEHPAIPRRLDEIAAGAYLAGLGEDPERTLFAGVRRLPPGHRLTATSGRVAVERWWDVDPETRIRYRRDEEYAEHFRHLFRRAVADRLPGGGGAVGVAVSGGLDSSAVAAVARRELARSGGGPLVAGSFVFERLPECDERPYLRPLVAELGIETLEIEADRPWRLADYAAVRSDPDSPALGWEPAYRELLGELRRRGARVLLTGLGGDEVAGGSSLVWAERLRRGEIGVLREVARHARRRGLPLWRAFYHAIAAPLAPPPADRALRRLAGRSPLPPWIARGFARRTGLGRRVEKAPERRFPEPARQEIWANLAVHGHAIAAVALQERRASRFGLEACHPFLDRRLFELVLAFPPAVLFQTDRFKPLLRRATAGILPEVVRRRQGKTSFRSLVDQVMRESEEDVGKLLAAPLLAELGWVDRDRLRAAWRESWTDRPGKPQRAVWYAVTLELWLRRHAGCCAGSPPATVPAVALGGRATEVLTPAA